MQLSWAQVLSASVAAKYYPFSSNHLGVISFFVIRRAISIFIGLFRIIYNSAKNDQNYAFFHQIK